MGLRLRDPSTYLERATPIGRLFARLNSGSGFPLSLNLVGLNATPSRVVHLIIVERARIMKMEDSHFWNVEWDKDKPWTGIITLANGKTAAVDFDIDETEMNAAQNTLKFLIENENQIRHKIAV